MKERMISRKIISVVLSVLMVAGMMPMMAFTSVAATGRVYAAGEWNYADSQLNSNRDGFDHNGPFFVSMAVADTEFVFMQTQDNQEFTYTTTLYAYKNNFANEAHITFVDTHVERDTAFSDKVTSSSWALVKGQVNDGGDSSPNGDELKTNWLSTYFTAWNYTENFIADGSAVYYPEWQIEFTSRGAGIGYTTESHNTAYTVIDGSDEAENLDPVLTIRVIDMRELRTLADMAAAENIAINDITGGRDLSGNTYYTQDVIDTMVAQLRERLLCDYSALDAQIARANTVEENVNGALGGHLYGDDEYAAFETAYNNAKAVDRYLTDEDANNQTVINDAAAALETALDNLFPTRKALINYYANGELFAQNTCDTSKGYNFHDVTDKFIGEPTMEHMVFSYWADVNGDRISQNAPVTGDIDAYASFEVRMDGIAPLSKSGKWEHKLSENDTDGRGDNYISMWVQSTDFNFMQVADNETFSFYTDLTAYKNDGGNTCRVNDVYLLTNDAETQTFIDAMGSHAIDYYCATKNSDPKPNNSGLPGALGSGYSYQSTIYRVVWRYIYTFDGNGAATYHPKWNIEYTSGLWALSAGDHDLPGGGDPYVEFTINVSDARGLINMINKAESIYHNPNSNLQFDQDDLEALRSILDFIEANYTLDGSVYYEQTVIDGLINQIKQVIPDGTQVLCDYTELDAAIALANEKRVEYNDNADNHYINEVWTNFMNAYNAATSVDRNLYIVDSNANQTMIDGLTEELNEAISALLYQTHVNQPCDYTGADEVLDEANQINNDNGKYDDDAYQAFEDAKQDLEDLLNLYDDEDGNNQQAIDDAVQALQDAIDALKDPANQNDPCDYTALEEAISAASAITDNELFTPATYQALQDALADAQAVPSGLYDDDSGSNQQMIDDATDALVVAINNLLADAIANAQNVDTNGMTGDSIQDLNDAVSTAGTIAADSNATPVEKSDAVITIIDAIDALSADKTELELALYSAGLIDTTDVPQALIDALDSAVSYGQLVNGDPDASVSSVEYATEQITNAIADILQQIIDDASNVDTTGMTTNSIQDLEDAIDNAQTTHDDANSSAYTLAEAIADVQAALADLEPDKTELEDAITAAQNVDTTGIPQNLVDALEDAINDGNTVDGDPDATVPEIKDATDQIKDALEVILQNVITDAENTDTDSMTPESIQDLQDAIDAANDILNDPDSTAQDIADAISDIQNAVDNLDPDKSELKDAITAAESIDTTDLPQNLAQALEDAITNGNNVDGDPDATVPEIKDATDAINDAIDDILQHIIDEAKNTDTEGMTDDSKQDLQDAIDAAEDLLDPNRDPEATAQEKADAIDEIISAVTGLALNKITTKENVAVAVDRVTPVDTQYTYMVGLNPAGTVVSDIKAQLKNDESMIIITAADGTTELTASDLVGTGCLIKLVNANDHSVVYEVATVILYGDVNGDGLVDTDDKDTIGNDAFYGESNLTAGSVYYIAADLSKDGTLDAFDYFLVDGIMTGGREFDQTSELYK
jgi:hypothetical protein